MRLVHLDIKPENIFIAIDYLESQKNNESEGEEEDADIVLHGHSDGNCESTDSGMGSGRNHRTGSKGES